MRLSIIPSYLGLLSGAALAQQYAGQTISNKLPTVNGAELAFFRTADGSTLLNYYSHNTSNQRIVESRIRRAVIVIHGSLKDGWNYETHMLQALGSGAGDATRDTTVILAPVFANQFDLGTAYQQNDSTLVWENYYWFYGADNIHPTNSTGVSSFDVIDQLLQYFDNKAIFPSMKSIVLSGHSRGAQMVDRYAKISTTKFQSQLIHYVGNPNGYLWLTTDRPVSTANCSTFDNYPDGLSNFDATPMNYANSFVAQGRAAVLANYNSKIINYAKGLNDTGDASDTCAPYTQGDNRLTRFLNWIKTDPPKCSRPRVGPCQTVDYVNASHDDLVMFSSDAGRARLFGDNFNGGGFRARDFGYPRLQAGDDPWPRQTAPGARAHARSFGNDE